MAAGGDELPLIPDGWRANYFELLTRCWLAAGRTEQAEQAAARAESTARRVSLPLADAMAHRAAAAVALARGEPDLAAERALASAAAAEEIDARVDAAVARTLAGRALAAAGDRERALDALEHAAGQLGACGALRYRSQAEHELRKLGRHPYRRTRAKDATGAGVDTLTAARGRDRAPGGAAPHEPRGGGRALPQRQDDRDPHAKHLPQARRELAARCGLGDRARRKAGLARPRPAAGGTPGA